jgi:hypothetical protein
MDDESTSGELSVFKKTSGKEKVIAMVCSIEKKIAKKIPINSMLLRLSHSNIEML